MKKTSFFETKIGTIGISVNNGDVVGVFFGADNPDADSVLEETETAKECARQIQEYLAGKRRVFSIPVAPEGTPFQKRIWEKLLQIPYGETRSYGEIADAAGCKGGARAVGMANNRNPVAIIIPCHRVIGANGKLVGYGGGLLLKEKLLGLEADNKNE
ncbi:MAG: methylated-DNA--[protein]-cysteine S-methyltransferase [Christensenellales bacterium]